MASSSTYSAPSPNVRTSLGGEATATPPEPSYLRGRPPSATWVPTPVRVKKAAMPAPPARSFSASVPWGVSSSSSSPERNWRSNSLFSPTYELIIFAIRRAPSSTPRPQSSTPQLLLTTDRSVVPCSSRASISAIGLPHSPKPPTASEAPSGMSATASAALATTLSNPVRAPVILDSFVGPGRSCHVPVSHPGRPGSSCAPAAVDGPGRAGHHRRVRAGEPAHQRGHLVRFHQPLHRGLGEHDPGQH